MKRWIAALGICAGLLVAGCGSESNNAPAAQPPAPAGGGNGGGDCPLTVEELTSAIDTQWTQADVRKDHPMTLLESVKVTACVYTAEEMKDEYGDPLVVRVDVVAPKDAGQVREKFRSACTNYRGTERAAGGGTVCDRSGTVVEGVTGNLNVVMIVNANKDTALKLTPSFEKLLAAAA